MSKAPDKNNTPAIGDWTWNAASETFGVQTEPAGEFSDLAGEWNVDAFGLQLDGLSRSRLGRTLAAGAGDVSCALGLSDGRRVQLAGRLEMDGYGRGQLFSETDRGEDIARPGPLLMPAYQPIISLRTGNTAGFEALARWSGDAAGVDGSFEDPALATNMLIHATQSLAEWQAETGRRDLFVQVNLTARDLAEGAIADLIETLLQGYDLPTGSLKVELTEHAALRNKDEALDAVRAIKKAGAGLVLDDFGSGHSSFAWLADMPADALKIDASLTARLGDERTEHILEAITLLAGRLGMVSTAEGVEDKAVVHRLRALGFTHVQGFAFSKPLDKSEALAFLKAEA
jgi:EAL domain-containing protein (putative c-di-GMP-specific phosphodiesterase class I)